MDLESAIGAVRYFEKIFPERPVTVEIDNKIYTNLEIEGNTRCELANLHNIIKQPVTKILIRIDKKNDDIDGIRRGLPARCRLGVMDTTELAQVLSAKASKIYPLKKVLNNYGLSMGNVISFGDDINDIEVLVAMGNASELVSRNADYTTCSNAEDDVEAF